MPLPVGGVLKDRYRISKVVHQSKLTNVYLVDDIHLRGNVWAVKEMKFLAMDNIERQKIIAMFRYEVARMTELSHPNFAKVIDFFVDGQNLYVIRQFIAAYDIRSLMRKTTGMLREKDVISWGIQLADVLNYLHKKNFPSVFFRELNLDNILVNAEGEVSLIDLGLATAFQMETNVDKLKTMGASEYASPEQFDEEGQFDQRTLVYNLGALIYHMLTKKSPAQNLFDLPPLESINPEVSSATCRIIKRATEIEPRLRYQSLNDFKRDLAYSIKHPDMKVAQVVQPEKEKEQTKGGINWSLLAAAIIFTLVGGIFFLIYKLFFN